MHRKNIALAGAGLCTALLVGVAAFASRSPSRPNVVPGRDLSLATSLPVGDATLSPVERGVWTTMSLHGDGGRSHTERRAQPQTAEPAVAPPEIAPEPVQAEPHTAFAEPAPAPATTVASGLGATSLTPGQAISAIPRSTPVASTGYDFPTETDAGYRGSSVRVSGGVCRTGPGGAGTFVLR